MTFGNQECRRMLCHFDGVHEPSIKLYRILCILETDIIIMAHCLFCVINYYNQTFYNGEFDPGSG